MACQKSYVKVRGTRCIADANASMKTDELEGHEIISKASDEVRAGYLLTKILSVYSTDDLCKHILRIYAFFRRSI